MAQSTHKIFKNGGKGIPTLFERKLATTFLEIEKSKSPIAEDVKYLYFTQARVFEVNGSTKAVAIFVPVPLLARFRKVEAQLIRELEKKFSGHQVVLVADRRILPVPGRGKKTASGVRARSRSLTTVHDSMLEDIVFPQHITGKFRHYSTAGAIRTTVRLNRAADAAHRFDAYATVFRRLTGKHIAFEA